MSAEKKAVAQVAFIEENKEAAEAVLASARQSQLPEDGIIEKNGLSIRIEPVPINLLDDVTSRIKDPKPPMVFIKDKDRDEPNPDDPDYLSALEDADNVRNRAAMDAMVLFGIDLIDGLPENESWIKKLKYLERLDRLDLSNYDLKDELDKEFLYKRYIIADAEVIRLITEASGVSPKEIESLEKSFPDN